MNSVGASVAFVLGVAPSGVLGIRPPRAPIWVRATYTAATRGERYATTAWLSASTIALFGRVAAFPAATTASLKCTTPSASITRLWRRGNHVAGGACVRTGLVRSWTGRRRGLIRLSCGLSVGYYRSTFSFHWKFSSGSWVVWRWN